MTRLSWRHGLEPPVCLQRTLDRGRKLRVDAVKAV